MRSTLIKLGLALFSAVLVIWSLPSPAAQDPILKNEVAAAVAEFKRKDPTLESFFKDSAGYVVFPSIAKAGFIIGGARGRGEVFRAGRYLGSATLTQATIGLQVGGQTYHEIIFFKDPWRLEQFMSGNFAFSASMSAVAVTAGAARIANYHQGLAVFTLAKGGLMIEAAVGGQKFSFRADPDRSEPRAIAGQSAEPTPPTLEIPSQDSSAQSEASEPAEVLVTEPLPEFAPLNELDPQT